MIPSCSSLERNALNQIRFILVVLVVFIHTPGWGAFWYGQSFAALPVPGFFLLSGYLFFRGMEGKWDWHLYGQKMRRRTWRLLVPYLLCNLVKLLSLPYTGGEPVQGILPFLKAFWSFEPSFCAPVLLATWFLRDLLLMCCLSPLLWFLVRWGRFVPFLLFALCDIRGIWPGAHVLSLEGLAFFSLGAAFTLCRIPLIPLLVRNPLWAYITGVSSLVFFLLFHGEALRYVYLCGGLWAIMALVCQLSSRWRFPAHCTDSVLFIYLGHALFVLSAVHLSLARLFPSTPLVFPILLYFATPLLTVALLVFGRTHIYVPIRAYLLRIFPLLKHPSE